MYSYTKVVKRPTHPREHADALCTCCKHVQHRLRVALYNSPSTLMHIALNSLL